MNLEYMEKIVNNMVDNSLLDRIESYMQVHKTGRYQEASYDKFKQEKNTVLNHIQTLCYCMLLFKNEEVKSQFQFTCDILDPNYARYHREGGTTTERNFVLNIKKSKDGSFELNPDFSLYVDCGTPNFRVWISNKNNKMLSDVFTQINSYFKVPRKRNYRENFFKTYDVKEALKDDKFLNKIIKPIMFPELQSQVNIENFDFEQLYRLKLIEIWSR